VRFSPWRSDLVLTNSPGLTPPRAYCCGTHDVGIDRFREKHWSDLERRTGVPPLKEVKGGRSFDSGLVCLNSDMSAGRASFTRF